MWNGLIPMGIEFSIDPFFVYPMLTFWMILKNEDFGENLTKSTFHNFLKKSQIQIQKLKLLVFRIHEKYETKLISRMFRENIHFKFFKVKL